MKTKHKHRSITPAPVVALPASPLDSEPISTLFQNVRIFDGKNGTLSTPSNVLVRGNKIERISTAPIPADRWAEIRTIDGGGRILMPGLIDAHWHATMAAVPLNVLLGYQKM